MLTTSYGLNLLGNMLFDGGRVVANTGNRNIKFPPIIPGFESDNKRTVFMLWITADTFCCALASNEKPPSKGCGSQTFPNLPLRHFRTQLLSFDTEIHKKCAKTVLEKIFRFYCAFHAVLS